LVFVLDVEKGEEEVKIFFFVKRGGRRRRSKSSLNIEKEIYLFFQTFLKAENEKWR